MNYKKGHWEKSHYVATGKRGYWSKYGGGEKWKEPVIENWVCQSCGQELYAFMRSYAIPFDATESARICPLCKHLTLIREVILFSELLELLRPFGRHSTAIANLLTLPLRFGNGH